MTFRIVGGWSGRGRGSARAYEELPAHPSELMNAAKQPLMDTLPNPRRSSRFEDGCGTMDVGSCGYEEPRTLANTRRISGTTRWTPKSCLNSPTVISKSLAYSSNSCAC